MAEAVGYVMVLLVFILAALAIIAMAVMHCASRLDDIYHALNDRKGAGDDQP